MNDKINANIAAHFGNIEDPRRTYLNVRPLINIITIALCAVIAGAEGWSDVELFGKQKKEWLSRFLDLKNGIPSHDTFGRLFARLDPEQFQQSFLSWVQAVLPSPRVRSLPSTAKSCGGRMTKEPAKAPFA